MKYTKKETGVKKPFLYKKIRRTESNSKSGITGKHALAILIVLFERNIHVIL